MLAGCSTRGNVTALLQGKKSTCWSGKPPLRIHCGRGVSISQYLIERNRCGGTSGTFWPLCHFSKSIRSIGVISSISGFGARVIRNASNLLLASVYDPAFIRQAFSRAPPRFSFFFLFFYKTSFPVNLLNTRLTTDAFLRRTRYTVLWGLGLLDLPFRGREDIISSESSGVGVSSSVMVSSNTGRRSKNLSKSNRSLISRSANSAETAGSSEHEKWISPRRFCWRLSQSSLGIPTGFWFDLSFYWEDFSNVIPNRRINRRHDRVAANLKDVTNRTVLIPYFLPFL